VRASHLVTSGLISAQIAGAEPGDFSTSTVVCVSFILPRSAFVCV
jgi:hypothetical protein